MNKTIERHVETLVKTLSYDLEMCDYDVWSSAYIRLGKSIFIKQMDELISNVNGAWWCGYIDEVECSETVAELNHIKTDTIDDMERRSKLKLGSTEFLVRWFMHDDPKMSREQALAEVGRMND